MRVKIQKEKKNKEIKRNVFQKSFFPFYRRSFMCIHFCFMYGIFRNIYVFSTFSVGICIEIYESCACFYFPSLSLSSFSRLPLFSNFRLFLIYKYIFGIYIFFVTKSVQRKVENSNFHFSERRTLVSEKVHVFYFIMGNIIYLFSSSAVLNVT